LLKNVLRVSNGTSNFILIKFCCGPPNIGDYKYHSQTN
jgi:hypothetical protein